MGQPFPGATHQTVGPFQAGNPGFDARAEVAQLTIDPRTADHVFDVQSPLFMECHVFPESAQAAHDVSVLQNKIGDFHRQRGQPGDAHQYYEAALATDKDLWQRNPDCAQAARDVSVAQGKLGER